MSNTPSIPEPALQKGLLGLSPQAAPEELFTLLALILDGISDAVTAQAPSGEIVYANQNAARLCGYPSPESLLSATTEDIMRSFALFDEAGGPLSLDALPGRKALLGETPPEACLRFRVQATGEERCSLVSSAPLFDAEGKVWLVINTFRDVTEQKRQEERLRILSQASAILSSSLEYETTLQAVTRLAVPHFADWCAIEIPKGGGLSEYLAVAHVDPSKVELAYQLRRRYPSNPQSPHGVHQVLRTGEPDIIQEIPDEVLRASAQDAEHLRIILELGLRSSMVLPLKARGRTLGVLTLISSESGRLFDPLDLALAMELAGQAALAVDNARLYEEAEEERQRLDALHRIGIRLGAELDQHKLVQYVTDETTALTGAKFGSFFYNVVDERGESYVLYTLSGAPREAFSRFPLPRNTAVFAPTFRGEGVVRSADITKDPRYGKNAPYHGMPEGHLPVRSYLAVPVVSSSGEVWGGLFFGHPERGVFAARHEQLVLGVSAQAAVALDNARLYREARQAEARLQLALEVGALGNWVWDVPDGKLSWSPGLEKIFGIPEGSFGGTLDDFTRAIHPEDVASVKASLDQALREKQPIYQLYRAIRPDGTVRWLEARGQIFYDQAGESARVVGVCSDVTERREAEKRERQLIREQAARAEAERAEAAIRQKAVELARSNRELEQFAYIASHDLQEPLRMVSSYTQLLARRYRGRLDANADDFIQYAVDGAQKMQQLIQDLLTYSRAGARGKEPVVVQSDEVLRRALANVGASLQETGAQVQTSPLPPVLADEVHLLQIFQNLLSNALKFHGEAPPRVHIFAEEGEEGMVTFGVRDEGIGIDPSYFERIFVIFQRLHGGGEYPGTGVGLAICKKLVERHGGRIWLESSPGQGATFYFTLPPAPKDGAGGEEP